METALNNCAGVQQSCSHSAVAYALCCKHYNVLDSIFRMYGSITGAIFQQGKALLKSLHCNERLSGILHFTPSQDGWLILEGSSGEAIDMGGECLDVILVQALHFLAGEEGVRVGLTSPADILQAKLVAAWKVRFSLIKLLHCRLC